MKCEKAGHRLIGKQPGIVNPEVFFFSVLIHIVLFCFCLLTSMPRKKKTRGNLNKKKNSNICADFFRAIPIYLYIPRLPHWDCHCCHVPRLWLRFGEGLLEANPQLRPLPLLPPPPLPRFCLGDRLLIDRRTGDIMLSYLRVSIAYFRRLCKGLGDSCNEHARD